MTQMRKFEQEAIATEIYEKIKTTNGNIQEELKKTKEYKVISSLVNNITSLEDEINDLNNQARSVKEDMNEAIENFNDTYNTHYNFKLINNGSYSRKAKLDWSENEWKVKQDIERKLAIALISPDWKDKLSTIIDDIASQFGV